MKKEFKPTRYGQWKMEHRIASYYITSTFFWLVHVMAQRASHVKCKSRVVNRDLV